MICHLYSWTTWRALVRIDFPETTTLDGIRQFANALVDLRLFNALSLLTT
jgi:hypothetical protein